MKYTNQTIINRPLKDVIELFDDPSNLAEWQPGFVSMKHISGEEGKPGSKYELHYKMGKRDVDMIETVLVRDLPNDMTCTYEAKNVWNKVTNRFEAIDENTTKYISENEFEFKGFMKLFGMLMPGAFKKQSQKYLDLFKEFVESK